MKHVGQPRNYQICVKLPTLIFLTFLPLLLLCPAILQAKPMSSGQAEKVVNGWLKLDPNPLRTQLGNQVKQTDVFTDDKGELIYYVIYLRPDGFVITPADDLVEPIIAFADDGTFDPSPDNPLGALVSRDIPSRITATRNLQAVASSPQKKNKLTEQQMTLEKISRKAQDKWVEMQSYSDVVGTLGLPSISDVRIAPLILSKWGQEWVCQPTWYCYNYYTPSHYPCGCVATAMSQLMRFHQYPGTYVWSNMPLNPDAICGSLTELQRQTIGDLCYDAAQSVDTTYGSGGSTAYVWKVRNALPNIFGYSNAIDGWNYNNDLSGPALNGMVNPGLDAGFPSLLGVSGTGGGHALLADGYGYNVSTLYHHLSMGWYGTDDVWYNLPNIDAYFDFDSVDECIYNVYTSGSGEIISGRVTDTSGNPISGATVTGVRTGGGTYNDTTDNKGIYALAKIPSSSTYTISVTKSGYSFTNQVIATGYSQHEQGTSGNKWGINFVGTVSAPSPPTAEPNTISPTQGVATTIYLQASDDGLPNPPGVMTYIITSLPSHGLLSDPAVGVIRNVPYTIAGNGNRVVYTPCVVYAGSDSFKFKANDGGTPPNGGDSNIATITINVQPPAPTVIYQTGFSTGLPSGWSIVNGGNTSDTWTDTNPLGRSNPNWTGKFMIADSEYAGSSAIMDEQLITQSFDFSNLVDVTVKFKHRFQYWSEEKGDVDVRIGEGSWINVARYQLANFEGQVVLDISSIADGNSNVKIRWHYYNADWEWYWGIDDVEILASTLSEPTPGDFELDCDVDFYDFAIFASAWLSTPSSGNWNPDCDISIPLDNKIDGLDLDIFTENWLMGL